MSDGLAHLSACWIKSCLLTSSSVTVTFIDRMTSLKMADKITKNIAVIWVLKLFKQNYPLVHFYASIRLPNHFIQESNILFYFCFSFVKNSFQSSCTANRIRFLCYCILVGFWSILPISFGITSSGTYKYPNASEITRIDMGKIVPKNPHEAHYIIKPKMTAQLCLLYGQYCSCSYRSY